MVGRTAGVDAGGTFTDVVSAGGAFTKVPSTANNPSEAVSRGLAALDYESDLGLLAHGTTVATNALLERSGGRVALVTNHGFGDFVEIARQNRPSLYDQWADRPEPLVPRSSRYEIRGRLDARGAEIEALGPVPELSGADSVAICLLHSDLNDSHERAVEAELLARGMDACRSSHVSPEFREYERASTTLLNAYLRPVCRDYLKGLDVMADEVLVMASGGGLVSLA
ncbi:MAG: hydantoinase/oxoprolinase N-terminal domain-containing protein, partial [Acidimicrobiales bacterium]